ncbi:MAG: glycosyltransferase family 2 protein [Planctomycetota bacterium]
MSFNEEHVLEQTIRACQNLSYSNKMIILLDDSTDEEVVNKLREKAKAEGCTENKDHKYFQEIVIDGKTHNQPIEIWESSHFALFHRPQNVGFKGGSLKKIQPFLKDRQVKYMYLLDADWHPQSDAIERTLEVIEADERLAFVQTKRLSFPNNMNLFQQYVTIIEEGCYHVDFQGRQVLGHPILFSGCCTLFRMDDVEKVGGFTSGHLTEDLDLTDRFWISGKKGVYLSNVINYGEVPFTYDHYRRQQERWAAGSAQALKTFLFSLLKTKHLGFFEKMSAIRQNAYFTTTLLTNIAIITGIFSIIWITLNWNSYPVEFYLYCMDKIRLPLITIIYACIFSNFFEPIIMILFKIRDPKFILHLPMTVWYAWSILPTYLIGNLKGFFTIDLGWFRTPKYKRNTRTKFRNTPAPIRLINLCVFIALTLLYFCEGWFYGWFDEFVVLLLPAFILASIK